MRSTSRSTGDLRPGEAAPAKINLALHVTGRRPDGYHNIDSLVVFADLGDELNINASEAELSLAITGPFSGELLAAGPPEQNLVLEATRTLARWTGRSTTGLAFSLAKNLPVAAGIGGGSADAAAALRILDRHWRLNLSPERIAALGIKIGADVAICLHSMPLRVTGMGDKIELLSGIPSLPLVLIRPPIKVSTAAAFANIADRADPPLPAIPEPATLQALVDWMRCTGNGLEPAVQAMVPGVADVLHELGRSADCLLARMSGSGSCCFGVYPTRGAAGAAASSIASTHPNWWIRSVATGASAD